MQITKKNYYSVLRRKIPEFRTIFKKSDGVYLVFGDLAVFTITAHEKSDRKLLKKIYLFANQCYKSKERDVWNAIGVSFFEPIIKDGLVRKQINKYVSQKLAEELKSLWSFTLTKKEYVKLTESFRLK